MPVSPARGWRPPRPVEADGAHVQRAALGAADRHRLAVRARHELLPVREYVVDEQPRVLRGAEHEHGRLDREDLLDVAEASVHEAP
eukprot:4058938-Pyramimonas_sp.AAC.1